MATSNGTRFIAHAYRASKNGEKRVFGYYFRTEEARTTYIADFLKSAEQRSKSAKEAAAKRSEVRKNMVNPFKVGDILYDSWGYDQTNIDFFQVVEIGPKSVKIRPIRQKFSGDCGFMSEYVSASPDQFTGDAQMKVLQASRDGRAYISSRHGSISKWDGQKVYQSHYA